MFAILCVVLLFNVCHSLVFKNKLGDPAMNFELIEGGGPSYPEGTLGSAGDVNGDGIEDIMFVLTSYPALNSTVFVVFGGSTFFTNNVLSLANFQTSDKNGFAIYAPITAIPLIVSGGCDFNNDGLADILVSLPNSSSNGEIFVLYGRGSDIQDIELNTFSSGPTGLKIVGVYTFDVYNSLSCLGDLNGDKIDDFVVGNWDDAVIFLGGSEHWSQNINLSEPLPTEVKRRVLVVNGPSVSGNILVSTAGDFNGDGYQDIALSPTLADFYGRISSGQVFIIPGGPVPHIATTTVNAFSFGGASANAGLGYRMAPAGDFNGDGFDDLLVASSVFDGTQYIGAIYVLLGRQDLSGSVDLGLLNSSADDTIGFAIYGSEQCSLYAAPILGLDDMNGDGFDEIAVGIHCAGNIPNGVFIINGRKSGLQNYQVEEFVNPMEGVTHIENMMTPWGMFAQSLGQSRYQSSTNGENGQYLLIQGYGPQGVVSYGIAFPAPSDTI